VEYDSGLELVIKVDYQTLPTTLDIVRKGGSDDKKINLTFDDGPDGVYTPQILDILKKYNIKATFFTVGNNIEDNLSIVKRIIQEGHEIGNHTFTHPNISHLSQRQLGFELNAHNLLLQSLTGRGSLLFRPPFDIDSEPQFVREALSIKTAAESGYQIVSMNVDPKDWMNPGTSEIVNRTIDGVDSGLGKVILLHDSGGDRSQTVSALPQIIEKLQAGGYQFVPTSELLGMTRDQVMPKVSSYDLTSSYINFVGFFGISLYMKIITAIFYFGLFLGVGRALIIGTLAIIEKLQSKFPPRHSHGLSTAVIIPAYNEGKVICKTIDSVLASEYKDFQILVINDGSSDNTSKTVSKKYGRNRRVILMDKPNTGKSDSINYGLKHTHADIVIIIDADTIFDRYTIPRLVRHFSDPNIAAVAGNAKVGNRSNLLTRIQAVEYITAQNLDRRAFSLLNCMTVVPGAVGAWRRQPLLDIGGVSTDTLAEDADATVALIRQGYKLAYDPLAYAYTEAPPTFETFMKQRFRWMFGNFQVAWKHRDTLFNPRYGLLGFVAFPNVIVFQIFFPLVSPFVDLYTLYILILGIANKINHPQLADLSYLWMTLEYYLAFLLLDLLVSFLAFCLERKEDFSLIFWIVIQRLFYRQLIYFTAIKAIITALHGKPVGWNKFERFGTVKRK
jgi:cellulose synthase/poly-beta-1,6-N-acetylglucosamine synthase-like glycosyltransferase/peptidoglycan/xylan/chitin deacetylase (PgdA/CDA1 family)